MHLIILVGWNRKKNIFSLWRDSLTFSMSRKPCFVNYKVIHLELEVLEEVNATLMATSATVHSLHILCRRCAPRIYLHVAFGRRHNREDSLCRDF